MSALFGRLTRRRVPHVQQLNTADCGPASLAMVLAYHGRHVSLDEVRDRIGSARDGVSAFELLEAARTFGLRGRAVKLEPADLALLPPASILHWRMSHFVVLERARAGGADIVDPEGGPRHVRADEFARAFTGVAILFELTDEFQVQSREASRLWSYARRVTLRSGLLGRTVVLSLLLQLLAMALPLVTGTVVDRVLPRQDVSLLAVLSAGIALVALYSFFASFVRAHLLLALRTRLDLEMSIGFLEHLLRLPFPFFQMRQTGDLMMRLNSNAVIRESLTSAAMTGLLDGLLVAGYLAVILATHAGLGLLVVALGAVRMAVFFASQGRYRELMGEALQAQADSSNYQVQVIEGIETLKTSGAERRATEVWSNLFVDVLNVTLRRGRLSALVDSLLLALELASPLVVLAFGAHLVLQGSLSLGTMLAMSALAGAFLHPLGSLVSTALEFQQLGSYIDRVDEVLSREPEQAAALPAAPALRGALTLERVSFRYAEQGPLAVDGVDLEIAAGSQVAIVGPSGSGKSTVARLIAALYAPTEGRVLFDGASLAAHDVVSLRRQIGFVPQHPYLFGATIRENIAMASAEAPIEDIARAVREADLGREVASLPLGLETRLVAGGSNFSGGQRQRIALARALLTRPALLVLDEATSHLDARSERRVYESLRKATCTRIVIAHRLSTVVDSDLIVVMDRGRIGERGTHEQLLRAGGLYAELSRPNRPEGSDPTPDPSR
ncbi:MAG: peptidase domain-containing ABC transporter [Candidatus Eisenbacteria bacterium]|nr:peptidase domain-containing ABC transporter [Candidatus Eisenbacteria bacterium]